MLPSSFRAVWSGSLTGASILIDESETMEWIKMSPLSISVIDRLPLLKERASGYLELSSTVELRRQLSVPHIPSFFFK